MRENTFIMYYFGVKIVYTSGSHALPRIKVKIGQSPVICFVLFPIEGKIGNQKNNLFVFFILLVEPDIEKKKIFLCFGFFFLKK